MVSESFVFSLFYITNVSDPTGLTESKAVLQSLRLPVLGMGQGEGQRIRRIGAFGI